MGPNVEQLERLAALHRAGQISDEEFAAAKAAILTPTAPPAGSPARGNPALLQRKLSETWRRRFAFFENHGSPFSDNARQAFRTVPFWTAFSIRWNWWAFFFGILYFLILGLWKRGLAILAGVFIAYLGLSRFIDSTFAQLTIGLLAVTIYALTANFYYFILVTQSRDEWNPTADILATYQPYEPGGQG